jgi:hypothetical protein
MMDNLDNPRLLIGQLDPASVQIPDTREGRIAQSTWIMNVRSQEFAS